MNLRKLENKDAEPMLEWMHDESVVHYMRADFAGKTIDDCRDFIIKSQSDTKNLHLAIVDKDDNYMGTVSLKNINTEKGNAEFAIAVRKCAMGKGYSSFGMREIINYGFCTLNLSFIYWCVYRDNKRAVRFYDKNGYKRTDNIPIELKMNYTGEDKDRFLWYCCTQSDTGFTK